jgi:hypothetical protein
MISTCLEALFLFSPKKRIIFCFFDWEFLIRENFFISSLAFYYRLWGGIKTKKTQQKGIETDETVLFSLLPALTIIASAVEKVHEDRTIKSRSFLFFLSARETSFRPSTTFQVEKFFDTKILVEKRLPK